MPKKLLTGKDGNTFSSTNQPKNRRKKSLFKSLQKDIEEGNDTLTFKGVEEIDEDGNKTGRKVNVLITLPSLDAMVMNVRRRILKSDRLLIDYIDRTEGKAPQKIDLEMVESVKGLNILNPSE